MTIRAVLRLVAVALVMVVGAGCSGDEGSAGECIATGSTAHRDLRYANTPGTAASMQSLDLYLPVRPNGCDDPVPLLVYVHGGAFAAGDKKRVGDKVRHFTAEGWALASINYRLARQPGAGPSRGVYPAPEQDVAAAVAYLVDRAGEYAIDPGRVTLLGHSAGAFLVALVGTDGSFLEGAGLSLADVACVVPVDGTYDIPQQVAKGGLEAGMYRNAFGDDPATWKTRSPTGHVRAGAGIPAFYVLTRGGAPRIAQAQGFADQLTAVGVDATAAVVPGLDHEAVNDAIGKSGDTAVTLDLMAFLERCALVP